MAGEWTKYFNGFVDVFFKWGVAEYLSMGSFALGEGAWFSLPAVIIMALATLVLVIGIRESATMNAVLVITKVGVVLFVIGVGCRYVNPANWNRVPPDYRKPTDVADLFEHYPEVARLLKPGDDP